MPGHGDYPPDAIVNYPGTHSPVGPILLAVFIGWWAGAMGNRQYRKGGAIIGATLAAIVGTGLAAGLAGGWEAAIVGAVAVAYLSAPLTHIVGIVDVVIIANRLNRGEPVSQWRFF